MTKRATKNGNTKKKRGRPAIGEENYTRDPMLALRMPPDMKADIDAWAKRQPDKMPRSEAIRRLIAFALASSKRGRKD